MDNQILKTTSTMTFLLPTELKREFAKICAKNDINVSQKIRHLMSWYIQKNQETDRLQNENHK